MSDTAYTQYLHFDPSCLFDIDLDLSLFPQEDDCKYLQHYRQLEPLNSIKQLNSFILDGLRYRKSTF